MAALQVQQWTNSCRWHGKRQNDRSQFLKATFHKVDGVKMHFPESSNNKTIRLIILILYLLWPRHVILMFFTAVNCFREAYLEHQHYLLNAKIRGESSWNYIHVCPWIHDLISSCFIYSLFQSSEYGHFGSPSRTT